MFIGVYSKVMSSKRNPYAKSRVVGTQRTRVIQDRSKSIPRKGKYRHTYEDAK